MSSSDVSLIITAFNHQAFIEECLDAALSQSVAPKEIIVVNDGSTDGTARIAARHERNGVRQIIKANGGPSSALNVGMRACSGSIIAMTSADDVLLPHCIETQRHLIEETRADVVTSVPVLIGESGAASSEHMPFQEIPDCSPVELFNKLFYEGNFLCAPSAAIRRSAWSSLGDFHNGLIQLQDYEYWMRATLQRMTIRVSAAPFIKYRMHERNLSRSGRGERDVLEHAFICRCASDLMDISFALESLYGPQLMGSIPGVESSHLKPFLFLRHPSELIRRIGYEMLIQLMGRDQDQAILETVFGFTRTKLFSLGSRIGSDMPPRV